MMRKYFKYFSSIILIPVIRWYLKKERSFSYKGISIHVMPGVFHPGLFYSTKFLLEHLEEKELAGKTFLELGCGTGLISIYAAQQRAIVTASDISSRAIENCKKNAATNNAELSVIQSDLFNSIPTQHFDLVIINPPYYAKDPIRESDFAWNCGSDFQYFRNLFFQLPAYTDQNSQVIMVLTKGCDLESIFSIGKINSYAFTLIKEKDVLFDEKDYLYELKRIN